MKRLALVFLFLFALIGQASAASYFWVAIAGVGTGTWDNTLTTNWATSSGGAPGAGPPTSSDTATFDSNSGTGTVTIASTAATSALAFGAANITTSFSGNVTFGTVTITAGTFVTGANTHSFTSLASTSGTRTLTLDGSTINITGASGTPWNIATAGALTFSATGSTVNLNGGAAGGSLLAICGGTSVTYGTFSITGAGIWTVQGATFAAFSYTSTTNKTDSISLSSDVTIAAAGTLTLAGNSVVNRAFVKSSVLGTQRTISVPSGATVTLTNVDFQDFASAGTFGTWTGTSLGDCLGNSGITFDASTTQTYTGVVADSWSTAARWTSRVPLPQDDVVVGAGATNTIGMNMPRVGRNIDFSNKGSGNVSYGQTPNTIFGNIALQLSGSVSGTNALTLAGRGAHTITSNGKSFPQPVTMAAFSGSYTLQDNFSGVVFTSTNGTINLQSFTMSLTSQFAINSGGTVSGSASSTVEIANTSGNSWNCTSILATVSNFYGLIKLTGNVAGSITFAGSGKTYPGNLWWSSTNSTGTMVITGANTFADFKIDGTTARTVTLPASTTTTVSTFTKSNDTAGQLTSLISSSGGTPATLAKASGTTILNYMSIKDITATGGNWYACYSTDGLGNTGWNIYAGACPAGNAGRLMMMGVGN